MTLRRLHVVPVVAMTLIVVASNILVQFPMMGSIGSLQLADILTWGGFTYPFAFLVTDLTNRCYGPQVARRVVVLGFACAVICSIVAPPLLHAAGLVDYVSAADRLARTAIASGLAFLFAQLLDIAVFNRMRMDNWWRAPTFSSVSGSILDTLIFFTVAFAPFFAFIGPDEPFALQTAPFFGVTSIDAPRWVSWALGDLAVKLLIAFLALVPYRVVMQQVMPFRPSLARS